MARGRATKHADLKVPPDNAGKRRIDKNALEPEALSETPAPPEWLGEIAATIWREVPPFVFMCSRN